MDRKTEENHCNLLSALLNSASECATVNGEVSPFRPVDILEAQLISLYVVVLGLTRLPIPSLLNCVDFVLILCVTMSRKNLLCFSSPLLVVFFFFPFYSLAIGYNSLPVRQ